MNRQESDGCFEAARRIALVPIILFAYPIMLLLLPLILALGMCCLLTLWLFSLATSLIFGNKVEFDETLKIPAEAAYILICAYSFPLRWVFNPQCKFELDWKPWQ